MNTSAICQSCGMPLEMDPKKGGTNADETLSVTYCSFCYAGGRFLDEGISLTEKMEKNVKIAMGMSIPEATARQLAEDTIPNLERWRR